MANMKRKLKWMAVVLVVMVVGLGAALFLWPRDRITPASWKEIRIGMTERDVEDILHKPGRDLLEAAQLEGKIIYNDISFEEPAQFVWDDKLDNKVWLGQRGAIGIVFDKEGHVKSKMFQGYRFAESNLIDRLRDWLGW
jgi:hypothetical protein